MLITVRMLYGVFLLFSCDSSSIRDGGLLMLMLMSL